MQLAAWGNGSNGSTARAGIAPATDRATLPGGITDMATEAYCVKCREKREMQDEKDVTMKNGRNAVEGKCGVCGTKLFRMVGKKDKAAT